MANNQLPPSSNHERRRKPYNVATSSAHRTPIGFARSVSPEERAWCETHSLGNEFLLAANKLNPGSNGYGGSPVYVLYIHAIEMALKSYLLRMGVEKPRLRRVSHNLTRLLEEARRFGLITSDADTDNIVDRLTTATRDAAIRYEMPYEMPLTDDVKDVATALIQDTQPATPMPGDNCHE